MDYRRRFGQFTIFFAISILINSCGLISPRWVTSLEDLGVKQAVSSEYHLANDKFVYAPSIDTNLVYVSSNEWVTTNSRGQVTQGREVRFDYLRFANDGVAYISRFNQKKPDQRIVNSLLNGQYCFYSVEDSIVKIEFYNHDRGHFQYWYGRITPEGIYFYKYAGRPWGTAWGKLNFVYRKDSIEITAPLVFPE